MSCSPTVGTVASQAGVTPKTVRYYEAIGLLPPPVRDANGYRRYDHEHLNRLRFILRAKSLGLSLAEIGALVAAAERGRCDVTQTELKEILDRKIAECSERINELIAFRASLEEAAHRLTKATAQSTDDCCPSSVPFAPDCNCVPRLIQLT